MKKNLNSARLISSILPNVLKPVTKKFTSKLFEIKAYWREIFEEDITSNCVPTKFYRINNKNILEITIISNNALEISYFSCKIRNKINNFFNSEYIYKIKFKNVQIDK